MWCRVLAKEEVLEKNKKRAKVIFERCLTVNTKSALMWGILNEPKEPMGFVTQAHPD